MRFDKKSFENMKRARGLDFIKRNMSVEVAGKKGKIAGNFGHNLWVRFDGDKHCCNCHPTWETRYFDSNAQVIKEFIL